MIIDLEHILIELMSIKTTSFDLKLSGIELILSFSELFSFRMINLLSHTHFLLMYHFLVLFFLFFIPILHLLH